MPCAVAMAAKGHDVIGYDISPAVMSKRGRQYKETAEDGVSDFNERLAKSTIRFSSLDEVVSHAEILFVAVQTPHAPEFEGVTPLPEERVDFNYRYLVQAFRDVVRHVSKPTVVSVISTVLPGTVRRLLAPLATRQVTLVYNPYFIAMGTTMVDFLDPEFVLCGTDSPAGAEKIRAFYETITGAPFYATSIENAELIKVTYNTFISMKIAFANTIMEVCHKVPGADVDQVTAALQMATRRIISGRYLSGGMGDGGGCHPRDNIAMSSLARDLGLSFDWFENVMLAREKQTEWLADLMDEHPLPKAILGYSFKAESNITLGSPALLLKNILERRGRPVFLYDPYVDSHEVNIAALEPMVFLIGVNHGVFSEYAFPPGSVVIDPWRYLPAAKPGVRVIHVGRSAAPAAASDAQKGHKTRDI
jgi:UDPglucose 6-dehydrogenase